MVDEIDTDVTIGSIGAAQSVCNTLSRNPELSQDQRAALFYADAILYDLYESLQEERASRWRRDSDGSESIIPMPPEVLNEDAMYEVIKHVHGNAEENR